VVTNNITDISIIILGIVVVAILFGLDIAISISINNSCTRLTRKLGISYEMFYRNLEITQ
jgi:hypothetical protein